MCEVVHLAQPCRLRTRPLQERARDCVNVLASPHAFAMAKHHPDLIMCRKQPGICAQAAPERACEMHVRSPPSSDPPISRALQRLAACAKSATASAPSATPTCGRASSCVSATSATTAPIRVAASSVASQASPMPTTARSARSRRRTYVAPRAHTHTRTHPPSRISPAVLTYCLRARERVCAAAARWLSKDRQPGLVEDRPLLRAQKVRLPQEVTAAGAGARTASAPPLEVERGQRRVGTERKKRSPCQPTKGREARVHGCRTPDLRVPQTAPSTINRRTIQRSCDHGVHRCDHTNRDENKSVCWPCRKTSEMGLRRVSETRRAGRARCFALRCRGPDTPSRTRPSRVLACRAVFYRVFYIPGDERGVR